MADAADSKSVALKSVWVQVPPSALAEIPVESMPTGIFAVVLEHFTLLFTLYRLFIILSMYKNR